MSATATARIPSRTAEGKHTKRFIIEVQGYDGKYTRSTNDELTGYFATREEAQAQLNPALGLTSEGMKYRVRQK